MIISVLEISSIIQISYALKNLSFLFRRDTKTESTHPRKNIPQTRY